MDIGSPGADGQFSGPPLPAPATRPLPEPLAPGQAVPKGMGLLRYVVQCLDRGCDTADIRNQLVAFGYPQKNADQVVAEGVQWRQRNPDHVPIDPDAPAGAAGASTRQRLNVQIVIGAILCLGGVSVTVLSCMLAAPGGTYVVAWGAIIFGAIQVFRGAIWAAQEAQYRPRTTDDSPRQKDSRPAQDAPAKPSDSRRARL